MENYLKHYGILGQKWGVRNYQNADGTLTDAGKKRYSIGNDTRSARKALNRISDDITTVQAQYHRAKVDASKEVASEYGKRFNSLKKERSKMESEARKKHYDINYKSIVPVARDNRPSNTKAKGYLAAFFSNPYAASMIDTNMMDADIAKYGEIGAGLGFSRRYKVTLDTPISDAANAVTREEFDALNQKIDKLINEINNEV